MNFGKGLNDLKAGMQNVDKQRAEQIIAELSANSKFTIRERRREQKCAAHIVKLRQFLSTRLPQQLEAAEASGEELAERLLKQHSDCSDDSGEKSSGRFIVHLDLDAFYAAVETRDNEQFRHLPMAVGSQQMLSTSNYAARTFGVRSAMPGYIAKALCPELIIVPPDFAKYREASAAVMNILHGYHEYLESPSLDEAYMDFTRFGNESQVIAKVQEMREEVEAKTGLTASCGIAPCRYLAKIASDYNKPNGQFCISNNREAIKSFLDDLPVRKVKGIGPVTTKILNSFDIFKCKDILDKKHIIMLLFSDSKCEFLLSRALGLGSNVVDCRLAQDLGPKEISRKSIGMERSFRALEFRDQRLLDYLDNMSMALASDLHDEGLATRTITVKLKTDSFEVSTRSHTLNSATDCNNLIFNAAKHLMCTKPMKAQIRLIGIRLSNLQKLEDLLPQNLVLDNFKSSKQGNKEKESESCQSTDHNSSEAPIISPTNDLHDNPPDSICPICNTESFVGVNNEEVNLHIDECLNSETLSKISKENCIIKNPKLDHFASNNQH